ncbi:MAG: DUF1835 domain-containing protein [Hyphomicrobiales bacterium]|nr:DUF1835 domain-containing protein [Hyphomicrobiales bacterium]
MTHKPSVHLVFSADAVGSVAQALALAGKSERVIGFEDNLSFGPIDPPEGRRRDLWIESVFKCENESDSQKAERFWNDASASTTYPIAWLCRNSAAEYCGFLEFVRRMGERQFAVIDASSVKTTFYFQGERSVAIPALGILTPEQIAAEGLCDRRAIATTQDVNGYRQLWAKLGADNAPFRIVSAQGLVSAPLEHFDEDIIASAREEWSPAAYVIGSAMVRLMEKAIPCSLGDFVLWARARALAEAGALEIDGSARALRGSRVRLGARRQ